MQRCTCRSTAFVKNVLLDPSPEHLLHLVRDPQGELIDDLRPLLGPRREDKVREFCGADLRVDVLI